MSVNTDYPDWSPHVANANQIAATGVPLLRNITVLSTSATINAGVTSAPIVQAYGNFYEGYLIEVIPQTPGSRIFAADLLISHLDASSNVVGIETVTVSNWQGAGHDTSIIRGRLLGTSLSVVVVNAASAWINTVTGGSVTADNVTIRFCGLQTFIPGTGKRVPIIQVVDGLLLGNATTVALPGTNGTAELIEVLPDYTGQVAVNAQTQAGGGFAYNPRISMFSVSNGTGSLGAIELPNVTFGNPVNVLTSLPSAFNIAYAIQRSTIAQSVGYSIMVTAPDQ